MSACTSCAVYRRPGQREAVHGHTCQDCVDQVLVDLAELVKLVDALPTALTLRKAGGGSGGNPNKPGSRPPVSLDALSLLGPGNRVRAGDPLPPMFLLREWALSWALLRVLDGFEAEYATTNDGRPYMPIVGHVALAAFLSGRVEWAGGLFDFPRFARELRQCVVATRQVSGELVGSARPIGWCPALLDQDTEERCLAPLSASTWVDIIDCPRCSAQYDRARGDWDRLRADLVDAGLNRKWR
jgi:hypothetical protein